MTYTIKCCGPSKDFFLTPEQSITTHTQINPLEIKALLLNNISPKANLSEAQAMLDASLIASKEKVLNNDNPVAHHEYLFLLPPVCGG